LRTVLVLESSLFKARRGVCKNHAASRSDAARITEAAVSSYRVYFLPDSGDHVASTDLIVCDTEAEAQGRAHLLVVYCGYPGLEVGTALG
jgi:hypothetical protein